MRARRALAVPERPAVAEAAAPGAVLPALAAAEVRPVVAYLEYWDQTYFLFSAGAKTAHIFILLLQ